MAVIVANKTGETDGPAFQFLQKINSYIPVVLVSRSNNFVFNEALHDLKAYVLVSFVEYGWNRTFKDTHVFGKNTDKFSDIFNGEEWSKFDSFVKTNPPALYFQREILKKDVSDWLLPIDYPCWHVVPESVSKEEFDARPINVFNFWGRSNELRLKFQAEVWMNAYEKGGAVCDNIYQLNAFLKEESSPNKWVSLHIPHYARIEVQNILAFNGLSKLSVSMPGAGKVCFRHVESSLNSVMVTEDNDTAFSHEWIDGENCIKYKGETPTADLNYALKHYDLYPIYLKGIENCKKYQVNNYIPFLEKLINGE
jgi:hypothetical protein